MVKFGIASGVIGLERGVTAFGDNVEFVKDESEKKEKKFLEEQLKKEITDSVSKLMRMATTSWSSRRNQEDSTITGPKGPGGKPITPTGKYVPPSLRKDDQNTLLVTNISEDADEQELRNLFSQYGPVSRFHLGKDRITHKVRGFAFVTYSRREHAERAMESLQGQGIDHLILRIEWADKK